MVKAKAKGTITQIEMAKIDHIWVKLKGAQYFLSLDIRPGYHHISIHPESSPKTDLFAPTENSNESKSVIALLMHQAYS